MEYISSDTNVWIDFMVTEKLNIPFRLPLTYLMNQDAVEDEILSPPGLKDQLLKLGLKPTELTEKEFYYALEIAEYNPKLSKYDCSALAIAKIRKIILLTGDAGLRRVAQSEGVKVIGTIGVLDRALDNKVITEEEYKDCIKRLISLNGQKVRLPMSELQIRLNKIEGTDQ